MMELYSAQQLHIICFKSTQFPLKEQGSVVNVSKRPVL